MTTSIIVQNLKCGGCAHTITTKIAALEGVNNVQVNNETSTVTVDYENSTTEQQIKHKLTALGYPATGDTNTITSKAKSFVSCAVGRMNK